eukprot:475939-Prymnesium_polylepis.2
MAGRIGVGGWGRVGRASRASTRERVRAAATGTARRRDQTANRGSPACRKEGPLPGDMAACSKYVGSG